MCILDTTITKVASTGGPAVDLVGVNQIDDYFFIPHNITRDANDAILRCATGLGPSGRDSNAALGGWYFNGNQIHLRIDINLSINTHSCLITTAS